MSKFKRKPGVVDAIQWNGGDYKHLNTFCGRNWSRADAVGHECWTSEIPDKEEVVVFNTAELTWLPVPTGWWIVRGVEGELYPCKPEIFDATYEPI